METTAEQVVYMNDLLEFAEVLESASSSAQGITTKIVHQMAEEIADLAYQYAPKKTGQLANSIGVIYGDREAEVVATAPYAAYIEFGTWRYNTLSPKSGTYEIRPRNANALRFIGKDGKPVFTKLVRHPGIRPQPFLGRANAEVIDKFTNKVANVGMWLVVR